LAKRSSQYVCQSCGAASARWVGRCESCDAWNSLVEETRETGTPGGLGSRRGGKPIDFVGLEGSAASPPRRTTGIMELDRVCGGGLVPGSAVLMGGDPGIGKSTLVLQAVAALDQGNEAAGSCIYISGEESVDQVRLRARRLGIGGADVRLAAATSVRDIMASLAPVWWWSIRSRPCSWTAWSRRRGPSPRCVPAPRS
jgi:DNA repair protein RadA/Sms